MIGSAADYAPDEEEARRAVVEELSRPRYADAQPTWFDYRARDIADFLAELFSPEQGESVGALALVVLVVVVLAAALTALLLWGRPRRSQRTGAARELLGFADGRTAAQLRAEAERRARERDWEAASILRFRAIARGLLERDIIDPGPGATAQAIARDAAAALAAEEDALRAAARSFDGVRYLGERATPAGYRALRDTDERLSRARPAELVP